MGEPKGISVEGIVSARDQKPYVVIFFNGQRAQLTMADARNLAGDIVQMCARTEADAMIFKFFFEQQLPQAAATMLMKEFRDYRAKLDDEPINTYRSEPTGGHGIQ